MGSAVPAQGGLSSAAGSRQTDGGECEIRFQLADRYGYRVFLGGAAFRNDFGAETKKDDGDIWAHAISNEIRDHRDDVHAGAGIRDALLGNGCGAGAGVYAHRVVLPVLRDIYWMAGRGADRQRHFIERLVWRLAAHHSGTIEPEPDSDVRFKQRRRGDGQDD